MNKNTKLVLTIVLLILVVVIIIQNTDPVNLKLLFWGFEASLIILLVLIFLIGLIIGYILSKIVKSRADKNISESS